MPAAFTLRLLLLSLDPLHPGFLGATAADFNDGRDDGAALVLVVGAGGDGHGNDVVVVAAVPAVPEGYGLGAGVPPP